MTETLEKKNAYENRWVILGMGYALLVMIISGYSNYTEPYDGSPVVTPTFELFLLWMLLYIPLLFPLFAKWEVKDLGFAINPALVLVSLFLGALCASMVTNITTTWYGAFAEAFARTGEEFFFRGFLFFLLIKLFEKKRRPWIWAVVGSALAFSLIHTQTFQPSFFAGYGEGTPVILNIAQRFLDLFISFGIVVALIRYWTKSILPGAIVHGLVKGGVATLPFVLVIYAIITYWSYRRKERVFSGFEESPKVAV